MASVKPKGSATKSQKRRAMSTFSNDAEWWRKMTPAKIRQEMSKIERKQSRLDESMSKLEESQRLLNEQHYLLQTRCKHVNRREVADEIGQGMTWECTDCGF